VLKVDPASTGPDLGKRQPFGVDPDDQNPTTESQVLRGSCPAPVSHHRICYRSNGTVSRATTITPVAAQLTVKLSGIVQASPQRVFDAMTDPEQVAEWWGPEGFTCPAVSLDPRVGGAYRIAMQPTDGELFHLAGEYVEVEPPSRLAYTFRWEPPDPDDRETVACLVLHERDGATEVELTQGPFATEARRELHRAGWTDTIARLANHLASA
jgi:uncharacterized protein YndB with AHSA1/START domain